MMVKYQKPKAVYYIPKFIETDNGKIKEEKCSSL
jgi:hypothetical protein